MFKNKVTYSIGVMLLMTLVPVALWATPMPSRVDAHAPITVMGDHAHKTGEWMWSYRYMQMPMNAVYSQRDNIDQSHFFQETSYMNYPNIMNMNMHMIGVMWAPSDKVTVMAMTNYTEKEMTVIKKMGNQKTSTQANGVGDLKLTALVPLYHQKHQRVQAGVGISLPTGAIDKKSANMTLGYPMQLGSGSVDLLPSITAKKQQGNWSLGLQSNAVVRLGDNAKGYRLGNTFETTAWVSKTLTKTLSSSFRLGFEAQSKIEGVHQDISGAMMNPAMDAVNSGGERLEVALGMNSKITKGFLRETRVAIEYIMPISNKTNGYQMVKDKTLVFGVQRAY